MLSYFHATHKNCVQHNALASSVIVKVNWIHIAFYWYFNDIKFLQKGRFVLYRLDFTV